MCKEKSFFWQTKSLYLSNIQWEYLIIMSFSVFTKEEMLITGRKLNNILFTFMIFDYFCLSSPDQHILSYFFSNLLESNQFRIFKLFFLCFLLLFHKYKVNDFKRKMHSPQRIFVVK